MKRVKLINCEHAKESNTGKVVDLYETPEELLEALPNAEIPSNLKASINNPKCVGFVINDTEKGKWIQVYRYEYEIIQDDMRKEGVDYEWMLVGQSEQDCIYKHMVIAKLPEGSLHSVVTVASHNENNFINGGRYGVTIWKFAKPIPKPIFTNSIGQEWFDEEDESLVYWFGKNTIKICCDKFCNTGKGLRSKTQNGSEIFKTKEDVENYVIKYINRK